jgi:hypothetical protein
MPATPKNALAGPATPAASLLPLNATDFSWERFEEFSNHLVSLLPGVRAHRYGTRGSDQRGIDLVATVTGGGDETYQCKQYRTFTLADLKRTVADNKYKASRHTIVVSSTVGTLVRDEIKRRGKRWRLWDATDIARIVRTDLDAEGARILIGAHFGPEWVERFLAMTALATFQSPGLFYAEQLKPGRAFHHVLGLVGRQAELEELGAFVQSPDATVYVLSGTGGSGKSRLAVALCADFRRHDPTWHIRVLTEGLPVTPVAARELPLGDCLIIVEDAHRRVDLAAVLNLRRQRSGRTKLLLMSRLYGLVGLNDALAWADLPSGTVTRAAPLRPLGESDALALARAALGADYARYAEALVAAAGDVPLVTVVGAQLLATKAVDPRVLERHEDFQCTVLDKFGDEATAAFEEGDERDLARRLLPLVAALQPLRSDDDTVGALIARFVKAELPDVTRVLGRLEEAGVLLRGGGLVRIVPDVLADHLLHRECVTAAGQPTRYADVVFAAFERASGARVLQNMAELDWRRRAVVAAGSTPSVPIPLLDRIWAHIKARFERASNSERAHLLEALRDIAYLQPEPLLSIVEYPIRHPSTVAERAVAALFVEWDHARVLEHLPPILQQISHYRDYLTRCCEILWHLGRDDGRDVNGGHPINVLRDIASYDFGKPLAFAEDVIGIIERWVAQADAFEHANSPLDILDPLMAKGSINWRSTRRGLSYTPFPISPDRVAVVQRRGIAILCGVLDRLDFPAVKRAIDSLDRILGAPNSPRLTEPTTEQIDQWRTLRLDALALLRRAAIGPHSLATFAVGEVFARHARYGREDDLVRAEVCAALEAIDDSYELRLARAVCESPSAYDDEERGADGGGDWRDHERRQAAARLRVAKEFLARHTSPSAAARAFEALVAAARAAEIERQTHHFWEALTSASARTAAKMAALVLSGRYSALVPAVDAALRAVAEAASLPADTGFKLFAKAVGAKDPNIRRAAALSLRNRRWTTKPTPAERRLFVTLLGDVDISVSYTAVGALWWVAAAGSLETMALDLLDSVDFRGNGRIAAGVARILSDGPPPRGPLGLVAVSDAQLRRLLKKLAVVDALDAHEILRLLDDLAARLPSELVELLLTRLSAAAAKTREAHKCRTKTASKRVHKNGQRPVSQFSEFRPFPHQWYGHTLPKLTEAVQFPQLVRRIRDQALTKAADPMALPKLFALATANLTASTARDALLEWIDSGDAAKLQAATALTQEAGPGFIFEYPQFVARVVRAARAIGEKVERTTLASLHISAGGGMIVSDGGSPGEPFPKDVTRRDRATAAAAALPYGSPERTFYESLARSAQHHIDSTLRQDEEMDFT